MKNETYLTDETPFVVFRMFAAYLKRNKPELLEPLRASVGRLSFLAPNKEDRSKLQEAFAEFKTYQRDALNNQWAMGGDISKEAQKYFGVGELVNSENPANETVEEKTDEPEMNFGEFDESKIRELGNLWSKGGKKRFYFKFEDVKRMLNLKISSYGKNGISHTESRRLENLFSSAFFDAVVGKFVFNQAGGNSIADSLEEFCKKSE